MRVAVIGSRWITDYSLLVDVLQGFGITEIISGGARGADSLAARYAAEKNIPLTVIPPDWNRHGRAAGPIRNREIVRLAELVVALWDGESRGTEDAIASARRRGVPVVIKTAVRPK